MDKSDHPLMGFFIGLTVGFIGLMVGEALLVGLYSWNSRETRTHKEICIEHCQSLCRDLASTMEAQTDAKAIHQ